MLKIILLPFSVLYGLILRARHFLYDRAYLRQESFQLPVIIVGNLEAGGSGKTPHTLLIANILKTFHPAILSRGYKRKTKGFRLLQAKGTAELDGDEPRLFKNALPEITVAVCENRPAGIKQILKTHPETGVVILDDAFQHRRLKPGFSVLLIDWQTLQSPPLLLPSGKLRDLWSRRLHADLIVLSKCPIQLSANQKENALKSLNVPSKQSVYISWYNYLDFNDLNNKKHASDILLNQEVILVCGIANPQPLYDWLCTLAKTVTLLRFPDHHAYNQAEVDKIHQKFDKFASFVVTTEKDRVKLETFIPAFRKNNWLIAQIEVQIDRPDDFKKEILSYATKNTRNN